MLNQIARTTSNLGLVVHDLRDYPRARELFRRAEALYEGAGDRWGIATALGCQARAHCEQGDFELAMRMSERSLSLYREHGDNWGIAHSLADLARVMLGAGSSPTAPRKRPFGGSEVGR